MDTVRWFKIRAKIFLKRYRKGDEIVVNFYKKYVLNYEVNLSRMQYAIVKSMGFDHWKAMLDASDSERRKKILQEENR